MKYLYLFFLVLFLCSFAYSLDCQYTEQVVDKTEYKLVPIIDFTEKDIIPIDLKILEGIRAPAQIYNYNSVDLNVSFYLDYYCGKIWVNKILTQRYFEVIPANSYIELPYPKYCDYDSSKFTGIKNIEYLESEDVSILNKEIITYKDICKLCLGKLCLNDGAKCSNNLQCGGGYCIYGKCNTKNACYNNNCNCSEDEFQQGNNLCVKRAVLEIGLKPQYDAKECITQYVNPETGLCAKSLMQIKEDRNNLLTKIIWYMSFIALFLFSIFILVKYKIKLKFAYFNYKLKQIRSDRKYTEKQLNKKHLRNTEKKKYVSELKKLEQQEKNYLDKIRIYKATTRLDSTFKKWQVLINDSGYEIFPNGQLFHLWYYKKFIGKIPLGYEIHHKDWDKRNNSKENLQLLTKEEHKKIHGRY